MNLIPKISFDVDGIVADYVQHAANRIGHKVDVVDKFYIDWIKPIHDEIEQDTEFWRTMPTMIQPNEIVCYIHCWITAIRPHLKEHREYWLQKNGYQLRPVYVSQEKDKLINKLRINIHVDDKLSTVVAIQENCPNCTPILHLPWYLRYDESEIPEGTIVTKSTDELMKEIQKLLNHYYYTNEKS